MPRQVRQAPPPTRERAARYTILGRPWPLPVSPVAVGLLLAFALTAGLAWYFEGRYETPPAEAAKLVIPYKADQVKEVVLSTPDGKATYDRDPTTGKFAAPGPQPTVTPTPSAESTPSPVQLSPSTQLESLLNQLHDLKVDRVVDNTASSAAEFGLDQPQFTLQLIPRQGAPATIAVGRLNPNETAYYVRREDRKDTALVSRYTLDDLMKVATDLIKPTAG
jgi:hypothetical protein